MTRDKSSSRAGTLFSIMLFFLFTLCMVLVMVIGANVYKNIVVRMDQNFNYRTAISYITNKVHQFDREGQVGVAEIEGRQVLELREEANGCQYHTLIYCMDGEIKELYKAVEDELTLDAGVGIVAAMAVEFQLLEADLLQITVEGSGGTQSMYLNLRSGGSDE